MRHYKAEDTHYVVEFDSWQEAVDYAEASGRDFGERGGWSGGTKAEAYRLARKGWPEGRKGVERLMASFKVTSKISRPYIAFDVAGEGGFDAGMLVSGVPECIMDWREGEDTRQGAGPIVTVAMNISQSASITAEAIEARGAAVLTLVDALEAAGRRVEVLIAKSNHYGPWNCDVTFIVHAKRPDCPLQVDQLTFATVHVASNRQIGFSWVARAVQLGHCPAVDYGYGNVPLHNLPVPVDIYLPRLNNSDRAAHFGREWVLEHLKAQGVSIEK